MADTLKDYLHAYRADPTNKYGGKDHMETLPTEFDKAWINRHVSAMKAGKEFGVPQLSATQLANLALHEGRDDFGTNRINVNNPKAMEIQRKLSDLGYEGNGADFAGALYDKKQTADRLGIPFEAAWNGTGKVKGMDRTGFDYAREAQNTNYAAAHPKNSEFVNYIDRSLNNNLTPDEKLINKIRENEDNKLSYHSSLGNLISPNANRLLQSVEDDAIARTVNNQIRSHFGLNPLPVPTNSSSPKMKQYNMDNESLAGIAMTNPEIKSATNTLVNNSVNEIIKAVPEYAIQNKTTLPAGYKDGGRVRLI
jgi:hypothetical protein